MGRWWLCVGWCLAVITCQAQEVLHRHYSTRDGLLHPEVYRLAHQRATGFLWIGTDYGLHRFDGHAFVPYVFNERVGKNAVLGLLDYRKDTLLVSYYREGVYKFANGQLFPLVNQGFQPKLVLDLAVDRKGVVWLMEKNRLIRVKDGSSTLVHEALNSKETDPWFIGLEATIDSTVYLASAQGLFRIDSVTTPLFAERFGSHSIKQFCVDKQGQLWVASADSLWRISKEGVNSVVGIDSLDELSWIKTDGQHRIWLATEDKRLYCFWEGRLVQIGQTLGISHYYTDFLEDMDGHVWLATQGQGVYRVQLREDLQVFPLDPNQSGGLARTFWKGDTGVMVGTRGALFRIKNQKMERVAADIPAKDLLYWGEQQPNGEHWMGTSRQLLHWHPESGLKTLPQRSILSSYAPTNTTTFYGTFTGVYVHKDAAWDTMEVFQSLSTARINSIAGIDAAQVWLGTDAGLYCLRDGQLLEQWTIPGLSANELITRLLVDRQHRLWVTTNHGVHCYRNGTWQSFDETNGLLHHRVNTIVEDAEGGIWVGALHGLSRTVDGTTFYPVPLQLPEGDKEVYSLFCDSGNVLYAGLVDQVLRIDLDRFETDISVPIMRIMGIAGFDGLHADTAHFELPYRENHLSVELAVIAFSGQERIVLEYRLKGGNTTWRQTTNRWLELEALDPGTYAVQVRARDLGQQAVSNVVGFSFTVAAPLWQQAWFLVVCLSLVTLFLWAFHRYRVGRIIARETEKQRIQDQLYRLKQKALQAMMNPHFVFNSLNAIQYYIRRDKKPEAAAYITTLSRLIRKNLQNAERLTVSMQEELDRVRYYLSLEQLRLKNRFSFVVQWEEALSPEDWEVPNMLLQPYVENAVWHGMTPGKSDGRVEVRVQSDSAANRICIIIEDNGPGFRQGKQPPANHRSLGMRLSSEMLQTPYGNGTVTVTERKDATGKVCGTRVAVWIPGRKRIEALKEDGIVRGYFPGE